MFVKLKVQKSLALITIFSVLGTVAMASEFANAQNSPENSQRFERRRWLQPTIPSNGAVEYAVLPPGEKITGRLGLPAA